MSKFKKIFSGIFLVVVMLLGISHKDVVASQITGALGNASLSGSLNTNIFIVTNLANGGTGSYNAAVTACKATGGVIWMPTVGLYLAGSHSLGTSAGLVCRVLMYPGVYLKATGTIDASGRWGCAYDGSGWVGLPGGHSVNAGFSGIDEPRIQSGTTVPIDLVGMCELDGSQQTFVVENIHFQNCSGCSANSPGQAVLHIQGFTGEAFHHVAMDTNWQNTIQVFIDNAPSSSISFTAATDTTSVVCTTGDCTVTMNAKVQGTSVGGTTTPTAHFMYLVPGDLTHGSHAVFSSCTNGGDSLANGTWIPTSINSLTVFHFTAPGASGTYTGCNFLVKNDASGNNQANTSVITLTEFGVTGNHNTGVRPLVLSHNGASGNCGSLKTIYIINSEFSGAAANGKNIEMRSNSTSCGQGSGVLQAINGQNIHTEANSLVTVVGFYFEDVKQSIFDGIDGTSGGAPTDHNASCAVNYFDCALVYVDQTANGGSAGLQIRNVTGSNWGYTLEDNINCLTFVDAACNTKHTQTDGPTPKHYAGTITTNDANAIPVASRMASFRPEENLEMRLAATTTGDLASATLLPASITASVPSIYTATWVIKQTVACTTGTATVHINFSASDGVAARTISTADVTLAAAIGATNWGSGVITYFVNANAAWTYSTTRIACSGSGTAQYDLWIKVKDMSP